MSIFDVFNKKKTSLENSELDKSDNMNGTISDIDKIEANVRVLGRINDIDSESQGDAHQHTIDHASEERNDTNATVLNIANNITRVNSTTFARNDHISELVDKQAVVCDYYKIIERIDTESGEAELFTCSRDDKTYVAKIYYRDSAVKDSVKERLYAIDSPYVAPIFASGDYYGHPVEIIKYYKNGNLAGKTYDKESLRKYIIPCLNEGLNILHENGIIHKDIKPSNIMMNDDNKSVVILDFGISSVREGDSTVLVTKTGLTPEYSAPETFRNLFLSESDYYSLGITIYELFIGHTPYTGIDREMLEQMLVVQQIPFPENMDAEVKTLIQGLTYPNITNRRNKQSSERRWGYEEVKKWIDGINQPIPEEKHTWETSFVPIEFCNITYDSFENLVEAMCSNWEEGKKLLFRGTLARHLSRTNPDIADIIWNAQDQLADSVNSDLLYFSTLYKICPGMTEFRWKELHYDNLQKLGKAWIYELRKNKNIIDSYMKEIVQNKALSLYLSFVKPNDKNLFNAVQTLETSICMCEHDNAPNAKERWKLAYFLSGDTTLHYDKYVFYSLADITGYLIKWAEQDKDYADKFCSNMVKDKNHIDPQFEAWLSVIGKSNELKAWKESYSLNI